MKRTAAAIVAGILMSTSCLADTYWCAGKLNGVYVTDGGDVVINGAWRSDWTRVCNLNSSDSSDTVTCSVWYSLAATAVKEQVTVQMMIALPSGQNCATISTYNSAPRPYYMMLLPQ